MKISNGSKVAIAFTLKEDNFDTEVLQDVIKEDPYRFVIGNGDLPEKFESYLLGLSAGDAFKFELTEDEGFGEILEENIIPISIDEFKDENGNLHDVIKVGNFVPMVDDDGEDVMGIVIEVEKDFVVVDFNHPLSGMHICIEGEVVEVL